MTINHIPLLITVYVINKIDDLFKLKGLSIHKFELIFSDVSFPIVPRLFRVRGTLVTGLACFSHASTCASRASGSAFEVRISFTHVCPSAFPANYM